MKTNPKIKTLQINITQKDFENIETIKDIMQWITTDKAAISYALAIGAKSAQGFSIVNINEMVNPVPTVTTKKPGRPTYDDALAKVKKEVEVEDVRKEAKKAKKDYRFMATCTLLGGNMYTYEGKSLCNYKRYFLQPGGQTVNVDSHVIAEDAGLDEWAKKNQFNSELVAADVKRPPQDRVFKYNDVSVKHEDLRGDSYDSETKKILEDKLSAM